MKSRFKAAVVEGKEQALVEKEKVEKEIEGILGDIKEKGIILRNIENGLSDFPSVKEGEDIFYCWTAEETQIQYWHYRYEGYSGRKPI